MSALVWLAPIIVATLAAIGYATWRGRPGPPEDTHEAMEARERFRRAIESGTPARRTTQSSAPAKGDDGDDADRGA
jgi:hypothetical protein